MPEPTTKHAAIELEYEQINTNVRFLADTRFKLLALLPTFGVTAVFALTNAGLNAGKSPASLKTEELVVVVLVSTLGFVTTLALTLYDQRKSQLYNALIHRAKHLEVLLGMRTTPGGLEKSTLGGQFGERPKTKRRYIVDAGHDLALALIYGPLLGAWLFPIALSILLIAESARTGAIVVSTVMAALTAISFCHRLISLDKEDRRLYHLASERDKVVGASESPSASSQVRKE